MPARFSRRFGLTLALLVGGLSLAPAAAQDPPTAAAGSAELEEAARLEKAVEADAEEGKLDHALEKAQRVLAIRRKALPEADARVGSAMADVGTLHLRMNDHVRAEPLLLAALANLERSRPEQKEHALALTNLAGLFHARGDSARARPMFERALAIYEKALGADHVEVGGALRRLAQIIGGTDYKKSQQLLERALVIHDKANAPRESVKDLTTLATLVRAQGKNPTEHYDKADVRLGKLPKGDLIVGELRESMGVAIRRSAASLGSPAATKRGREQADAMFAEAERVFLGIYGPRHTRLADLYSEWALNAEGAGDVARAVELRTKANDIEEAHLAAVLASGSEQVKESYMRKLGVHAEDTVSLHGQYHNQNDQGAARLALTTILRRKGRVLDALASGMATLREQVSGDARRVVDDLLGVRADLSALVIRGPGATPPAEYRARVLSLETRATELEARVSAESAAFRIASAPVTLEAVQAAIPEDAALVEIFRYRLRDARSYNASVDRGPLVYGAWVLKRTGKVGFMRLGDGVDHVVTQLRTALADPARRDVADPGSRLYSLTLSKLEPMLRDVKRILISPDGALNLIPFGALVGDRRFLAERWAFSYLSSGRDLLRFKETSKAREAPMIMANPSYDAGGPAGADAGGVQIQSRGGDLSRAKFPGLPGTREEAQAIAKVLPGATRLGEADATEASLKKVHGPEILHVATHGFFLSNDELAKRGGRGLELEQEAPAQPSGARPTTPPARSPSFEIRSPLLRSGLALAGANVRRGGSEDDGILTALEASGLDLHGTRLVVLSACETGVGEVSGGEGVYGLRRALVIAGSETQVMSLWKVDDAATRDMMTAYYQKLRAGAGRSEAMRDVQVAMMHAKETEHPYYWASFIVSGNPAPLGMPATSAAGASRGAADPSAGGARKVEPGARGCGCEVPGGRGAEHGGLLAAVLAIVVARRRRAPRVVSRAAP